MVLPGATIDQAIVAAERVRDGVEKTAIHLNGVDYPKVTVSIGITALHKGDDLKTIINAADEALYIAKNEGRNRSVLAKRSQA